jgi:hypothetical protein
VPAWLRPLLWPLLFVSCAALLYFGKVQDEMVDFEVYRVAAGRALKAEPLYRPADGHYQFKYLPASALALAPFAILHRETARLVWFALSAGLLTAFVRWSVRALPERRRGEPALLWLTLLFMAKFYAHELTLGQTNILLGALLVGALLAAQVDAPRLAGGLIGAAAFVKPYALLLLPWLAFTQGAAAAVPGLAVLAAGLLLPAVLYGWSGNVDLLEAWYQTVTGTTSGNLLGADNVSIAAMWAKWSGIGTPAAVLAALTIAAALALVVVVWSRRSGIDDPNYLEVALLMLLVPLLSPQGWDYVLLLATPAVVCLVDRWSDVSPAWRTAIALCLAAMGLTLFDLMGRELYHRFMMLSIVTVAALGAAVSLAHLRWRGLA